MGILLTLMHRQQIKLQWQRTASTISESIQYLVEIDRQQHAAAKKALQGLLRKR